MQDTYQKRYVSLKHFLAGRRFNDVLKALDIGRKIHVGERRDGTPEFSHQIDIALYISTLALNDQVMAEAMSIALLHDSYEDYGVCATDRCIMQYGDEKISNLVYKISKVRHGEKLTNDAYYNDLSTDLSLCIVKICDRIHNLSTAYVFSEEKRFEYLDETVNYVYPLIKAGQANWPEYFQTFYNMKMILRFLVNINHQYTIKSK